MYITPNGVKLQKMGVNPKIGVFTPQIIPCLIGFGTIIFTIHFGVFPLFLVQHPNILPYNAKMLPGLMTLTNQKTL